MKRTATIDICNCKGTLEYDNEQVCITHEISLTEVKVIIESKYTKKIESEEIIQYDYRDESTEFKFNPLVYWLIRGIHGIPLDKRDV